MLLFQGTWPIECMTGEHFMEGMKALYTVNTACTEDTSEDIEEINSDDDIIPQESSFNERTYFIAAVEGYWNFAPVVFDPIHNRSLLDPER